MEKIILVGGGGHCKSVIDSIIQSGQYKIEGIIDLPENIGSYVLDIPVIESDCNLKKLFDNGIKNAFMTIGSIRSISKRVKLYNYLKKIGFVLPSIVDETAIVSKRCKINECTYVGKGAVINCDVFIGNCSIINTGSIIEHECKIGNFVHIAPGSVLSGSVRIGDGTHIGTNSTVIQDIIIGDNSFVGAGSVVVKNIKGYTKSYGNPCKTVGEWKQ